MFLQSSICSPAGQKSRCDHHPVIEERSALIYRGRRMPFGPAGGESQTPPPACGSRALNAHGLPVIIRRRRPPGPLPADEIDHLNGKPYIDRLPSSPAALQRAIARRRNKGCSKPETRGALS